ncbi:hypothetical protein IGI39_004747 [Enterococcus sp. AZ135]
MLMRSQRSSKIKPINYAGINELKSDLKRMIVITLVSIGLSVVTYRLDNCYRESLFCTILSILASFVVGCFYWKMKRNG